MPKIKLYNTMTSAKQVFVPINPCNIRIYVCGPTVYDRAHIGNARPVVVFDILYRLLRLIYGVENVCYARNFTDIDDKINAKAAKTHRSIRSITDETIQLYCQDMNALGALEPDYTPRATEYIPQMIAMIQQLYRKNFAYNAQGHVLFDVNAYRDYGILSGRKLDDMIAGARIEIAPYKRNPMDFVLWKPSNDCHPGWDSPWGYGRPGWHIECSAMAYDLFGKRFDIHGGGIDLIFPHHENEISQSCACYGAESFAQIWMHNEMMRIENEKMSKSAGNFLTVQDLLQQGYGGCAIRFALLNTHYRKPMDWTYKKLKEATAILHNWQKLTDKVEPSANISAAVVDALAHDLNTPKAITALHKMAKSHNFTDLKTSLIFMGLNSKHSTDIIISDETKKIINTLLQARQQARKTKNFAKADHIRNILTQAGVIIKDTPISVEVSFTKIFNPKKLENKI